MTSALIGLIVLLFFGWRYMEMTQSFNDNEIWMQSASPKVMAAWIKIIIVIFPLSLVSLIFAIVAIRRNELHYKLGLYVSLASLTLGLSTVSFLIYKLSVHDLI